MNKMLTVTIEIPLHRDPQAEKPAGFCPVCGMELYLPGLHCIRCERREEE
jgi:hypothetical protein